MKSTIKKVLLIGLICTLSLGEVMAQEHKSELLNIYDRLQNENTKKVKSIDSDMQYLVRVAALTSVNAKSLLKRELTTALKAGVAPIKLRECIYQGMGYIGLARCIESEELLYTVMQEQNLDPNDLPNATTVNDENRFTDGLKQQTTIFGDAILTRHQNAKEDEKDLQVDLLTSFCFGDIYTRRGLTLKEREFLTFCFITALGGCEPQVSAHVNGNLNMGTTREQMLDALEIMVGIIGFPQTLNAFACLNQITAKK